MNSMKVIKPSAEIIRPAQTKEAIEAIYSIIEEAGRTCYKSKNKKVAELEERIEELFTHGYTSPTYYSEMVKLEKELKEAKIESARNFIKTLIKNGHEAMLEHAVMTVKFILDRGVSHELVRHRIASFAQESTRYCNYGQDKFGSEITVIKPFWFDGISDERLDELIGLSVAKLEDKEYTEREAQYVHWYAAMQHAEDAYFNMLEYGATPEEARSVLPNSLKTEVMMTASMREWRHIFKLRAAGVTGKPHPQMVEVMKPLLKQCQILMPELFGDI